MNLKVSRSELIEALLVGAAAMFFTRQAWAFFLGFGQADLLAWLIALVMAVLLVVAMRALGIVFWIGAGVLMLAGLFAPFAWLAEHPASLPKETAQPLTVGLLFLLGLAPLIPAALALKGLRALLPAPAEGGQAQAPSPAARRVGVIALALAALVVVKFAHSLYDLMLWDTSGDSLSFFWLFIPVLTALLAGLVLGLRLPLRLKYAGLAYAVLLPALMIAVTAWAQQLGYREATASRAMRVTQAVERYHAREGVYPAALSQLTPRDLLSLSRPVVIMGQEWCYQGGADYYALGFVYRDHWSDPRLYGQVFTSAGQPPDKANLCDDQIDALVSGQAYYSKRVDR